MNTYSMPDGYTVLSHQNTFYLIQGFYYKKTHPLEHLQGKLSRIEVVRDVDQKTYKEFPDYESACLYAWEQVKDTYL